MGGYGPQRDGGDLSDAGGGSEDEAEDGSKAEVNVNERRTRRGVYAVLQETDDDDSEEDEDQDVNEATTMELEAETGTPSEPASMPKPPSSHSVAVNGLMTPGPESLPSPDAPSSSTTNEQRTSARSSVVPFEPVISTRAQKARAASMASNPPLITPPLSEEPASNGEGSSRSGSRTRSTRASTLRNARSQSNSRPSTPAQPPLNVKGKGKAAPEPETRNLRGRPPHASAPPPEPKKPKKHDPKKPICDVCGKLCPLIIMGGSIIWGDFEGTSKKPKKIECPRYVTLSYVETSFVVDCIVLYLA